MAVKSFLALVLLITLPLQGYAAVAMPFCQHGAAKQAQVWDAHHGDHAGAHSADHAGAHSESGPANPGCDDCTYCQACASPVLPTLEPASIATPHAAYDAGGIAHFFRFTPEQPHRPPLAG